MELLESYLKGRKHRAKVGNSISLELEVKSGVPQGSVLGPLFFIIFINDLPECIMSSCFGYADDYKVIATNTITLQIDANRIWKWCSQNLITSNINKRKTLKLNGNGSISMNEKTVEQTQKEKDLGIIVSNDLTWTANAERRCEKAIKVFFTIKRNIAKSTSWIAKKNLYRSYVVPIISYGAILWKPNKSEFKMIENLHKKASKWILGTNRLDYKDRLKRYSILPLSLHHEMHVLLTFVAGGALELLESYLKRGALELLESYLKGRKHRAKVGNSTSSELKVKSGVPQGSVLGPLFFIIFINDLPECIMSSCFGYADDYKVIATNTITLQNGATRIWKWCSQNLMTLNINKCKTLKLNGNGIISMKGKTLEQTQKEIDLGIIVSNDLTWTANPERRCEKAIKVFFTIKRNIAKGTSWIAKKNLYRSYIVPII